MKSVKTVRGLILTIAFLYPVDPGEILFSFYRLVSDIDNMSIVLQHGCTIGVRRQALSWKDPAVVSTKNSTGISSTACPHTVLGLSL